MDQHPSDSQREWLTGIVVAVHPETWEVDVRLLVSGSAVVRRCKMMGLFLPEVHNTDPDGNIVNDRQSKVAVGWVDAFNQSPIAHPFHNTMIPDTEKANHVYWSEHLRFRQTIDRSGNFELRNSKSGKLLQFRIQETDGVVRIDVPSARFVIKDSDGSIDAQCDGDLTATCKNATVTAEQDVTVQAGGNASLTAGGNVNVTGAIINLN